MTDASHPAEHLLFSLAKTCVFIDELAARQGKNRPRISRGRALADAKDADTDYNIYYCAADPELGEAMLKKQQSDGVDAHSLAVDPLFVDPDNGDFRFKPDSPALNVGDCSLGYVQGRSAYRQGVRREHIRRMTVVADRAKTFGSAANPKALAASATVQLDTYFSNDAKWFSPDGE